MTNIEGEARMLLHDLTEMAGDPAAVNRRIGHEVGNEVGGSHVITKALALLFSGARRDPDTPGTIRA